MEFYYSLSVIILFLGLVGANVVDLTSSNFDQYVDGSKAAFVEFYAPWCGHCKRLAPAYEEVGKAFVGSDVLIAKVDADADKTLGGRFGVRGFPTLKFFPQGSTTPQDYSGGRTADDIIKFINEQTGSGGKLKKPATDVVELDPSNFDKIVLNSDLNVLVEFYAPWCGHCKSLIPTYEEVATTFKNDENCVIAKVDADGNKEIASRFGVSGYPTIKFFDKDDKEPVDYNGGRTTPDFIKYLNEKCGTNRIKGGALSPDAGIIHDMNDYAKRFMQEGDSRENILSEAEEKAKELESTDAEYYVKVMKKIQEKGEEFVQTEDDRLGRMLKGGINPKKSDEFTKRKNVLKKFEL